MEADRVVSKTQRIATLLYKTWRGAATLDDRLEVQALVVTCDGPTYAEAMELARVMRDRDSRPALFAPSDRFAA